MHTWKIWAAFGLGVVAGATVALVYAPQSGARTRKQLQRGLEDAADYLKETAEELGKQAERSVRAGMEAMENMKSKAEWMASKITNAV
ncbi:MAG: YtxH domain-containing protein [Acidobacteriaceae bacterium]